MSLLQQRIALAEEELATAQILLQNARYRACISRTYYGLYYATQALLTSVGLSSRTHRGTIRLFSQHFVKTGQLPESMAKTLGNAYDLRRLSDYEETAQLTQEQSLILLQAATDFVEQAKKLLIESGSWK